MDRKIYDIKELTEKLGISRRTVFRMLKRGEIKGFIMANEWHFEEEAIEDYIQLQKDRAVKRLAALTDKS